ncbi:transcription factor GTE2-like isoform X2 [Portunus trituberculatus]|uniref:CLOCK-interacting pacemaker n=1 Tax=Portunus trituberculatus TaxID=210409 RepID=A0A5B7EXD5_PORTR|nr:transcription factor GTE2-like isoform X2 [Portunus trituberculatus]MPC37669.1 CLOCK-interacting pacemaker [Portunus trituberculatus]
MTKLPQAPKMGVGVHEVVEMYATSLCDTEPIIKKEPVVSSSTGQQEFKRRLSEITQDASPRPLSPTLEDPPSSPSPDLSTSRKEISKRARVERSPSPESDSDSKSKESYTSRRKRFLRTAEALRQSGLLDITMKTADLLRKNQQLQREIEDLQKQTKKFVLSVLSNPENSHILENIRSGAQLYEVVVPGSQGIMSVSTQQTDVNMNLETSQTEVEDEEDSLTSTVPHINPFLATAEADSGLSNPSPQSNFSNSPASSVSSFSNDTSSLSEDDSSSEEENLSSPRLILAKSDRKRC